jgi:HlyD family secretion protein
MKHSFMVTGALAAVTTVTAGAIYAKRATETVPQVITEAVSRGPIVSVIAATGTLEAVTTVDVGTQVSGTVQALYVDFNSIVRRGQVVARLDPSLFQSAIDQAQANLTRAEADLERLQVAANDAQTKLQRSRELAARQLIPSADLDASDIDAKSAAAQVRSAAAQVTQARAALNQAKVNLEKTVITSPIDGIVISRNVDVGQTVAASLQAPTIFEIAADLTQMQLKASIDESDVGRIAKGQAVTFHVDAFPEDTFAGVVEQVRLNPVVESNVVTYAAIITAPNTALKLKPGMTANLTIVVARRDNVLRVPATALRFRPSDDVLASLGVSPKGVERQGPGVVWRPAGASIEPVRVNLGLSDGTYAEVLGGLTADALVVTRVSTSASAASPSGTNRSGSTSTNNPLLPSRPPGPPPR